MEIGVLNAVAIDFADVEILLDGLDVRSRDPIRGSPDDGGRRVLCGRSSVGGNGGKKIQGKNHSR